MVRCCFIPHKYNIPLQKFGSIKMNTIKLVLTLERGYFIILLGKLFKSGLTVKHQVNWLY